MGSKVEGTETSILCVFIDARLMVISDPQNNLQSTREENQHDILEQKAVGDRRLGGAQLLVGVTKSSAWMQWSHNSGLTSNFENL
jgi:hypothetical protein